jgi:ectoine hydroxylase-related dioxygenase (phytanoyl-CoA dioxygenase family)
VCSSEEVAQFEPVITSASQRFSSETRPLEERDIFGKAFNLVGGIWNRDEQVARFTLAKRFARIAAELMGVEGVRLYHDVSINKKRAAAYTPWHQDAYYWPMDTPHTITMWMPLVTSLTNGRLEFRQRFAAQRLSRRRHLRRFAVVLR